MRKERHGLCDLLKSQARGGREDLKSKSDFEVLITSYSKEQMNKDRSKSTECSAFWRTGKGGVCVWASARACV